MYMYFDSAGFIKINECRLMITKYFSLTFFVPIGSSMTGVTACFSVRFVLGDR